MTKQKFLNTKGLRLASTICAMLLLPDPAYADLGLSLIYGGITFLLLGTVIITAAEGILIGKAFRIKMGRLQWLIVFLANFFSGIIGALVLVFLLPRFFPHYFNSKSSSDFFFTISYFLSILLEWPFFFWLLRNTQNVFRKSFYASFIAQTASYLLVTLPSFLTKTFFYKQ